MAVLGCERRRPDLEPEDDPGGVRAAEAAAERIEHHGLHLVDEAGESRVFRRLPNQAGSDRRTLERHGADLPHQHHACTERSL